MSAGLTHGLLPGQAWVSEPHQEFATNERLIINWCLDAAALPRSPRPEYFVLPFSAAVEVARSLPTTRADQVASAEQGAAVFGLLRSLVMGGAQ